MVDVDTPDRRKQRHLATREELIGHAIDLIGQEGAGGLSLAELARRIGVRTPSLYTYFPAKAAVYDELFQRGWRDLITDSTAVLDRLGEQTAGTDLVARALEITAAQVRWHLRHPALAQLMLFRPVPRWEPSPEAYGVAIEAAQIFIDDLRVSRDLGLIRPDVDPDAAFDDLANMVTGVVARHLSNEPGAAYGQARASRTFPALVATVIRSYQP